MGKIGDKFLNIFGLDDDEDDYDDYDDYEDEDDYEEEVAPKKSKFGFKGKSKSRDYDDDYDDDDYDDFPPIKEKKTSFEKPKQSFKPASSKVVPMKARGTGMEVCVIKPTSIEDSREITDTLLSGRAVVLNLEGLHLEIAQRIIDFCSGSCYSMNGNLQKISNYIFIVTPETVDISGDFQELLSGKTGGFDIPL